MRSESREDFKAQVSGISTRMCAHCFLPYRHHARVCACLCFQQFPLQAIRMSVVDFATPLIWLITLIDKSVEDIRFLGMNFGRLQFECTGQNFLRDGMTFRLSIANSTLSKSVMPARMQLQDDKPLIPLNMEPEHFCKERAGRLILCGGD